MKFVTKLRLLIVVFLSIPMSVQADSVVSDLFLPLYKVLSGSESQSAFYEAKEVKSYQSVLADFSGLDIETKTIYFQLNQNLKVRAEKTLSYINEVGGLVWEGNVGEKGSVLLVRYQDELSATITVKDRTFQVSALGNLEHEIVELNPAGETPDHDEAYYREELNALEAREESSLETEGLWFSNQLVNASARQTITVIVAFTSEVSNGASLAQQGVALTNQGFRNSGINTSIKIAHIYRTSTRASDFRRDKADFRGKRDGRFDEVHQLRDQHRADIGVLITSKGSACGSAFIGAGASSAFVWVKNTCATHRLTFGHELGHTHGARHNIERDSKGIRYGHGYCGTRGNRSIMALSGSRCSTRINFWSDPNRTVRGEKFGTSRAHNARLLNEKASKLANFR